MLLKIRLHILSFFSAALWLISGLVMPSGAHASIGKEPLVQASFIASAATITENQPFWVGLKLTIAKDWHVYWQNPGDSGIPTSIEWQDLPSTITASPIHWPVPERQPYSGLVNYGYSNEVVLPIALTPKVGFTGGTLKANASWLVCKDICIPESAALTLTLPQESPAAEAALARALAQLPTLSNAQAHYSSENDMLTLRIAKNALPDHATIDWFFPIEDGIIQNAAAQTIHEDGDDFLIKTTAGGLEEASGSIKAVLTYQTQSGETGAIQLGSDAGPLASAENPAQKPDANTPQTEANNHFSDSISMHAPMTIGVLLAMGLAFLGGVLLNLMPCVLPIVALKAFAIAQKGNLPTREIAFQGLAYTAGILSTMSLLGIAIYALKAAGEAVGWGFQLQSPEMIVALAFLMLLVGMFLLDWLRLPALLTGLDQSLGTKKGISGSFFTGALSVAVATPCTAPFMAPALGAAAIMPPLHALGVLLCLGLGLAFPYLLISLWPPARRILPKPGVWMENFKQFLAFPMFATASWLLWVLVQLNGSFGLAYAFTGMVTFAFSIWLYRRSTRKWLHILAFWIGFAAITYAIIKQPSVDHVTPSHQSMMQGVTEMAYSAQTLADLRAKGTPVFVDATAAWCISCQVNERVALKSSAVQQFFKDQNITFMIADWTKRDAHIRDYLAGFGRNGVPLYVWYAPGKEGVVLPQILTPSIVIDTLKGNTPPAS